jgi:hypothetical protein
MMEKIFLLSLSVDRIGSVMHGFINLCYNVVKSNLSQT